MHNHIHIYAYNMCVYVCILKKQGIQYYDSKLRKNTEEIYQTGKSYMNISGCLLYFVSFVSCTFEDIDSEELCFIHSVPVSVLCPLATLFLNLPWQCL
jgi:hypothetical protein